MKRIGVDGPGWPAVKPSGREGRSALPPGINPPVRALPATSLHFWDGSTMGRGAEGSATQGWRDGTAAWSRSTAGSSPAPKGLHPPYRAGIKPGRPSVEPFVLACIAIAPFVLAGLAWLIWFKPYLALSMGISGAIALSVTAIIRSLAEGDGRTN